MNHACWNAASVVRVIGVPSSHTPGWKFCSPSIVGSPRTPNSVT